MKSMQAIPLVVGLLLVVVGCGGGGGGGGGSASGGGAGGAGPGGAFEVVSAEAASAHAVNVRFSRAVEGASARDVTAFAVPGLPVYSAAQSAGDPAVVVLETGEQAGGGAAYEVQVGAAVRDAGGAPVAGARRATFAGGGLAPHAFETLEPPAASLADLRGRGFAVEDDPLATNEAPSDWRVDGGTILQGSNIYGGDAGDRASPAKPGTALVFRGGAGSGAAPLPADHLVEATVDTLDDDGIGLVVRHGDSRNHYRFDWLRQGSRRQIVKVVNGVATRLAFDLEAYEQSRAYRLRLQVRGTRLSAFVDDVLVLAADDGDLAGSGAGGTGAGLYCWGSLGARFDDVRVQALAPRAPAPAPAPLAGDARPRETAPLLANGTLAAEPRSDRVVLWARASAAAGVVFEYGTAPDLAGGAVLRTASAGATAARDFAVEVDVTGLAPATRYFYRAIVSDSARPAERNASPIGTFATLPAPAAPADVVFAYGADIHPGSRAQFGVFEKIAAHAPLLFLSLGDFPYADAAPAATTTPAYREKHREIRSDRGLLRFLRDVPIAAVWDDHEVENDWDGATSPARAALGMAAWRESFPVRPDPAAAGSASIYRAFRLGRDVDLFILDTRSARSANAAADGPQKTILGAAQRAWLERALVASTARFKVIATSVPLRYGTTATDHWSGFATERTALFDLIARNRITGVVFLAGDQHWAAVHHHPEGVVEVQACPTAAFLREPPASPDPHVVFIRKTQSYGLVRARVAGPDPRLEIEIRDGTDAVIHTEVVR